MMFALGIASTDHPSGYMASMFHLFTHAFFKALLFLGAGSVIHAAHTQELSELGGLSRRMPWTRWVFLIGSLSMAGMPLFSGFWSKDAVLLEAQRVLPLLMWVLLAGAVMTAAYTFRLYLRCFHGEESTHAKAHPSHESPAVMVIPLVVLAVGAAIAGLAGSPWTHNAFFHMIGAEGHHHVDMKMLLLSIAAVSLGFWLALTVGVKRRNLLPLGLRPLGSKLYQLAVNKYYVDEIYSRFIIQPFLKNHKN